MNIDTISSNITTTVTGGCGAPEPPKTNALGRPIGRHSQPKAPTEVASDNPPPSNADQLPPANEKTPGVLRLLNEGHFKPVADVRLRINFYDKLAQQAVTTMAASTTDLNETLVTDLSEAIDSLEQPDRQSVITQLTGALAELQDALPSGQSDSAATFEAAQNAVTNFLATATEILTPADPAPSLGDPGTGGATHEAVPTETTSIEPATQTVPDESPPPPDQTTAKENPLLVAVQNIVDQYLQELSAILDQANMEIVPVENVPGSAYAKFLAIYQDLLHPPTDPPTQTDTPSTSIDTIA